MNDHTNDAMQMSPGDYADARWRRLWFCLGLVVLYTVLGGGLVVYIVSDFMPQWGQWRFLAILPGFAFSLWVAWNEWRKPIRSPW